MIRMLDKLSEHAQQIKGRLPPLYNNTPVGFVLILDHEGNPLSPRPISRFDPSTQRGKRGKDMPAPEVQRTSAIKPLLLADKGDYTFGRPVDPKKQARADKAHAAYRDLLDRCASETGEPSVLAVQRFYERGGVELLELGDDWDYSLKVVFAVNFPDGSQVNPIDLPSVQDFWLSENSPVSDINQCLICGERKPTLGRLQTKIKGIKGGQPSGTSLISANKESFWSYGLQNSGTAPTCAACGQGFTVGLNDLLAREDTHLYVGDTTFAFWAPNQREFRIKSFLDDPKPEQVKRLLESVTKGRVSDVDETAFYAATFSASGGRAVVRDLIDTTVGTAKRNIADWFDLQRIVHPRDEDPTGVNPEPLNMFRLAASTVHKAQDLPVGTVRSLFRAALNGTPLPGSIAFQAVRRNRVEQAVPRNRAALIKLVLMSNGSLPRKKGRDYMVALEQEHPQVAYHCGRLLAVIEQTQRAALGKVNATVVDRYYGAASATPAKVFGSLLRGAQPHLAKLDGGRRGGLQRDLMEVCGRIAEFPRTLSLEQQALFSLGYYHQKEHSRARAMERKATRGEKPGADPTEGERSQ